jgi:hypothetical protein
MNELSRDEDLLATCWTTAGDAAPLRGDEQSPIPLQERVERWRWVPIGWRRSSAA